MAKIRSYKDNCIKCSKEIYDSFYCYIYKGKSGYCCKKCGYEIRAKGFKLLEKAVMTLEKNGVKVVEAKEKFGFYRLTGIISNKKQDKFMSELLEAYRKNHSDFEWDWSWF